MKHRNTILWAALATLVGFGGLGSVLVPMIRDTSLTKFLSGQEKFWIQLAVGASFGVITAKAGWQLVEQPFLESTKSFFARLIGPLKLNSIQIAYISICAGIGEEMFFRGAIQPMLGIWFTAILFVLLHGYLNPFNMPLTIYGTYMVLVIGVMGLFTEHFGIVTSMLAHTIIDIILLRQLALAGLSESPPQDQT